MKILGVALRKPSFNEVTASAVMAAGIWLAYVAISRATHQPLLAVDAGAALLIIFWGCVCTRVGIRIDQGLRHLAVNVVCGAVILTAYQGIVSLLA